MNTTKTSLESISALLDNELSAAQQHGNQTADEAQLNALFVSLADTNGESRKAWDEFHLIADALHSDDLALTMSADFSSKFAKMLDAEPTLIAPKPKLQPVIAEPLQMQKNLVKSKFSLANYMTFGAIAAASALAFLLSPQLIPGLKQNSADQQMAQNSKRNGIEFASVSNRPEGNMPGNQALASYVSHSQSKEEPANETKGDNQVEMLRDPRLDSYLMAHQKSSPSLASTLPFVTHGNGASASAANGK